MTVNPSIDPARMLEEDLAQASPDLLRELLGSFINTLLSTEADAVCGASYGQSGVDAEVHDEVDRRGHGRDHEAGRMFSPANTQ